MAAMTFDGGGGGGLILFYSIFHQKKDGVVMQGVSARTFSARLYWKLWEHVVETALKIKYGYNDVAILNSSCHLHQPIDVLL